MKMNSEDKVLNWLKNTVISLNLCPFAKTPFLNNEVKIISKNTSNDEQIIEALITEIDFLKSNKNFTTTLLVLPNATKDFFKFYELFNTCEDVLEGIGLSKTYQIVCFHPTFVFENCTTGDRANFVNRSPIPLIHILLKLDVETAVKSINIGENISFKNEELLNSLPESEFKKHFPD